MKTLGISISLKTVDAPAVNAAGVFLLVGVVGRRKAKKLQIEHKNAQKCDLHGK
uniref:hypothetical protein n=1 Tax=Candidatus Limisoma sp. TaxID=3076476 RepID=UPI0040276DD1